MSWICIPNYKTATADRDTTVLRGTGQVHYVEAATALLSLENGAVAQKI